MKSRNFGNPSSGKQRPLTFFGHKNRFRRKKQVSTVKIGEMATQRLLWAAAVLAVLAAPARADLFGGYKLEVTYGSTAADGKLMTQAATSAKPTLKFADFEAGAKYTVIMVDPDAPSAKEAQKGKYYMHWILKDASGADLSGGTDALAYNGPTPPPGSGVHRYEFYV